jgi:hypothetical protein
MSTALQQHNALLPKLAATRTNRARAHHLATTASSYLHSVAIACTTNDDAFARLQSQPSAPQSVSAILPLLDTVKAAVEELEAILPAIQATWDAAE